MGDNRSKELERKIEAYQKETGATDDQIIDWFFEGYVGKKKKSTNEMFGEFLRDKK